MSKLEDYGYDASSCIRCSNCKWIDPVYTQSARYVKVCPSSARYLFDAYSAQGRLNIAAGVLDGELDYSPTLLDIIYKCTMGGACDTMCKRNIDLEVLKVLEELRAEAYRRGKTLSQHDSMVASIKDNDNPWGLSKESKYQWHEKVDVKDIAKDKCDVLFFSGCAPQDERLCQVPRNSIELLKRAGVDVGILGEKEKCCGFFAYQVGERQVAVDLIKENIETFNKLGISMLVTSCAACFNAFLAIYPMYGEMNFKVLHISQLLDQLLQEGKLKFSRNLDIKVTYHDPCNLGRMGEPYIPWEGTRVKFGKLEPPKEFRRGTYGVYEPPRNVLRSIPGLQLVEMERMRENAWCCGAGGGVKTAYPDFALWSAKERLQEMKETGADSLVTCCPHCETNFMDAIEQNNENIKVYDLVALALQAMPGRGQ